MRAVQEQPELADCLAEMGVLLQGNLQCFGDPPHSATRQTAERFLAEGRYFALGSNAHNPKTMAVRMAGLGDWGGGGGRGSSRYAHAGNPGKLMS